MDLLRRLAYLAYCGICCKQTEHGANGPLTCNDCGT